MAVRFSEEEYRAFLGESPSCGRRNKYKNRKVTIDGIDFPSVHEGDRYAELKLLEKSGAITDLRLQPSFVLVPAIKDGGKTIQQPIKYKADFSYMQNGKLVVEDAKGVKTAVYDIKKKLMRYVHGIEVIEI